MANTAARFHFTPVEKSTCPGYDKEVLIQLKSGPAKSPYSGALYVMPSIVDLKANLGEAARIGHLQRFVDAKAAIDLITGSPQNLSLDAIAEARLMAYIYTLFAAGGRYDYQRTPCGEFVKTYTPFASFHFGLFMATAKFPLAVTLAGSGYYNRKHGRPHDQAGVFGNSKEDEANLQYGYFVYQNDLLVT